MYVFRCMYIYICIQTSCCSICSTVVSIVAMDMVVGFCARVDAPFVVEPRS